MIHKQKGFTLLEMAVATIILGLLFAPLFALYDRYLEEQRIEASYNNVKDASTSIQDYRSLNAAYPCPAPMTAQRGTADYGRQSDCLNPPISALTPGQCANGICVEDSTRSGFSGTPAGRVIVGTLPFRDMQVSEKYALDGYGRRLLYAVSAGMSDPNTFSVDGGAISVRNEDGNELSSVAGNVPFVVLSHGKTGEGAYTKYGQLYRGCQTGATLESENCNDGFEDGSGPAQSIYVSSYQSKANNAGFYDDFVLHLSTRQDSAWRRVINQPEDIETLVLGNVGVGIDASGNPAFELDIAQGVNTADTADPNDALAVHGANGNDGRILVERVCDETGANCFDPELLAGVPSDVRCASDFMIGFEDRQAVCGQVAVVCPDDQPVYQGVNASNNMICGDVPQAGCAAGDTLDICGTADFVLDSDLGHGESVGFDQGDCRAGTATCDNGALVSSNEVGYCVDSISETRSCYRGYSGTITVSQCGVEDNSDCQCVGLAWGWDQNCESPQTGRYRVECVRTVQPNSRWCAETCTNDSDVQCTCPSPVVEPSGYTCSDGSGGSCRLVDDGACPENNTGSREREQRYDDSACEWNDTGYTQNSCSCDDSLVVTSEQQAVCANPSCEEPDTPDIYEQTVTDPSACTLGAPVLVTPGTCVARRFTWTSFDVGNNRGTPGPGDIRNGDSCSCSELGQVSTCFPPGSGEQNVLRCRCQE